MGFPIPKGTMVQYSAYTMNRDKALWGEDADVWDPERWLKPGASRSGGATTNYAMTTFGHGPRRCLGMNFARVILPCLISAVIGRFEVRLCKGSELGKAVPGFRFIPVSTWVQLKRVPGW